MSGSETATRNTLPAMTRRRLLQTGVALGTACGLAPLSSSLFAAGSSAIPDPEDAGMLAVDGGRIWYRVNGRRHFASGRTPLVVVHGGPGASHHYLLPLTDLADERPVILYDQLDSGRSERPGDRANWTVARFVSELHALRAALGLDRLCLLGSSCGATWAAEYAMQQPHGLRSVVLASPFLSAKRWTTDTTRLRAALPADVLATMRRHERAGTTASDEYHQAELVWARRHVCRLDPWPDYVMQSFELFNADLYGYLWGPSESLVTGVLKDYEAEPRLSRINVPVLYTCGEHDEATPDSTRAFQMATLGAKLEVFADASHTPQAETRAAFIASLRKFLAKTESDARG